jgi:fatty acid desaturase
LGKLIYWNMDRSAARPKVMADRNRLKVLSLLIVFFFLGGMMGAIGFKHIGYLSTVPLALILCALAIVPTYDDLVALWGRLRKLRLGS